MATDRDIRATIGVGLFVAGLGLAAAVWEAVRTDVPGKPLWLYPFFDLGVGAAAVGGVILLTLLPWRRNRKHEFSLDEQVFDLVKERARTLPELQALTGAGMEFVQAATDVLRAEGKVRLEGSKVELRVEQAVEHDQAMPMSAAPPPVEPGPELPGRTLTEEEEAFLFGSSDRPEEPLTAGMDRPIDHELSRGLGRARKAANAIRDLLGEVRLPPLDVLRNPRKSAIWRQEQEQATLGRYMSQLHGHLLRLPGGPHRA